MIGNPIAHSKSPIIHSLFAEQTQQSLQYSAMLSSVDSFEKDVILFFNSEGKGLNVTVPFKLQALEFANELSERAKLAGAVNTLIKKDKIIVGENTDGVGLVKDIKKNHRFDLENKKILLIGAGGASRGVIAPLLENNPKVIFIVNRTESKAKTLVDAFSKLGNIKLISFKNLNSETNFDLIINASSAGLSGELPALPENLPIENTFCYDMVYSKNQTPFLAWAKNKNCQKTADGLGMLVEQAAESFYLWRGVRPDTQSVLEHIRAHLL